MSTESLNRTSDVSKDPSPQVFNTRVNVDVLKQRLLDQKKKKELKELFYFLACVFL